MPRRPRTTHIPPTFTPSDELVGKFQEAWSPIAGHAISREDAVESMHNLVRFFEVLERWAREDGMLPEDPASELEAKDQARE